MRRLLAPWTAALLLSSLAACSEDILDTTRKTETRGTLGEEIYKLFAKDLEHDDHRRAQGFELAHDDFVAAIDHLFPPDELSYTQSFLLKLLPLYDDGTVPATTRPIAATLQRLAQDPAAAQSLAAMEHRIGYVDLRHEQALIRRIAHYPDYRRLMKAMLRLAQEHDGLDAGGARDALEDDALTRVMRHLSRRMAEVEVSADAERDLVLMADLMLEEDQRLVDPAVPPNLLPAEVVLRDVRGMARVHGGVGGVPAPFTDTSPQDGLPDVDELGRFVAPGGAALELPPFGTNDTRDPLGRLLSTAGQPVYDYADLQQTMLAGLMRDSRQLIAEGIPMKAVRSVDKLLGQRLPDGTYGKVNSPLLELTHAGTQSLNMADLPDALELLRVLLESHQDTTAWALLEMQAQNDISDRYPVGLRPGSSFFNDIMSTVRKILREPGLAEALLVALRDPAVATLPAVQAKMMSFKKQLITEGDVAAGTIFTAQVDRSQPDLRANQSIMQRTLHLIHDTKGARYVPEFIGIPIGFVFQIDDLAEFYLLSIIGRSSVPGLVATLTGLSTNPTPEELAVFINQDQTFGNPQGHEGIDVKDNDGDTLYAATASGMTDALRPLIQVFYDHGQMRLLFELFEVLHVHWASMQSDYQDRDAGAPRYSKLSGIRNYEPLLVDTFQHARVLDSAIKLLRETENLRTTRGIAAHDMLLKLARKLLDKDTALMTRDGKREVIVDGERITPLSPFDLIRGARARIKSVVRGSAMSQADWDDLVDAVHRTFLEVERTGAESGRLKSPRALPIASRLLAFMEQRARQHAARGDLAAWMTTQLPTTLEDAITSPELPAMFDLIYAIDADPELSTTLAGLRDELLAEDRGFADLLVTLADGLQATKDASIAVHAVRFLGRELDPDELLLFHLLTMADKSLAIDTDEHLLEVIHRGLDDAPGGDFYVAGLSHGMRQAHRFNPLDDQRVSAQDILKITGAVGAYLLDDQHGLEKFYDVVKHRKLEARP